VQHPPIDIQAEKRHYDSNGCYEGELEI